MQSPCGVRAFPRGLARNTWGTVKTSNPDGRLVVDRFERIADMMGVSTSPFVDLHKDKVDEMKRNLMDYVKTLQQQKGEDVTGGGESSSLPAGGGLPADTSLPNGQISMIGVNFERKILS